MHVRKIEIEHLVIDLSRIEKQDTSWTAIDECYDKATDLFTDLKTNDCAMEALEEAHTNQMTGCPHCDLYFYCAGNFNAMQCEELGSFIGIGDKEKTIKNYNLCLEEAYLRGTQESYDAKQAGKSAASVDACNRYLEPEGCNYDPSNPAQNRALSNEDQNCYGQFSNY